MERDSFCTTCKRQISEDGITITELVFNFTGADYFSLVPAEEVNEYNQPLIEWTDGNRHWPLEVRTVRGFYRDGLYYFTIVREHPLYSNEFFSNSYGREIANLVGEYFGDVIFRRSDLYGSDADFYSFDEFRHGFEKHIFGMDDVNKMYILCFSPTRQSEGYYYKAFTGSFSSIEKGACCPFGNTIKDESKVDHTRERTIEMKMCMLNSKKVCLPTEYEIPSGCTGDEWDRLWNLQYDLERAIKQKKALLSRIGRMKRQSTISLYQKDVDELTREIEKNPLWPEYAVLEENRKKNEEAQEDNDKIDEELSVLEGELEIVRSAEFTRLRRAGHEECQDCPFYDFGYSLVSEKVICKISSVGLSKR